MAEVDGVPLHQQLEEMKLDYFPLLELPNELILKIISHMNSTARSAIQTDMRICQLDKKPLYRVSKITTSEEWSEIDFGYATVRTSMKNVMDYLKLVLSRMSASFLKLKFARSSPYHSELLEMVPGMKLETFSLKCLYENGRRHARLSEMITDDFVRKINCTEWCQSIKLKLICPNITPMFIFDLFSGEMRHMVQFRVYIPRAAANELIQKCRDEAKPRGSRISVSKKFDKMLRVKNSTYKMWIWLNPAFEGSCLKEDDVRVEIKYSPDEDYY